MQNTILLENIEKEYTQAIQKLLDAGRALDSNNLIELSSALYSDIKIEGIPTNENMNADMLLFQYGVYNWGDDLGEHFRFDITRQFITEEEDGDFYQLSLSLIYEPTNFRELRSHNSWSRDSKSIAEWIENIKATHGYQQAQSQSANTHRLIFTQV
jgi:hypothetical protein